MSLSKIALTLALATAAALAVALPVGFAFSFKGGHQASPVRALPMLITRPGATASTLVCDNGMDTVELYRTDLFPDVTEHGHWGPVGPGWFVNAAKPHYWYPHGSKPVAGAIAVWGPSAAHPCGYVAWVQKINPDGTVHIYGDVGNDVVQSDIAANDPLGYIYGGGTDIGPFGPSANPPPANVISAPKLSATRVSARNAGAVTLNYKLSKVDTIYVSIRAADGRGRIYGSTNWCLPAAQAPHGKPCTMFSHLVVNEKSVRAKQGPISMAKLFGSQMITPNTYQIQVEGMSQFYLTVTR